MNKLDEACKEAYKNNETNCSGFLRDVCAQLNVTIDQGNADSIATFLESQWTKLGGHAAAKTAVDNEELVVAALKSSDSNKNPKPKHGHVAIVVPGELYRKIYPKVYCGGMSPLGRSQGDKSVGEIWATVDRDSVKYYQAPVAPDGLFKEI